jgi:thiamine biosynthesis lipoprotein
MRSGSGLGRAVRVVRGAAIAAIVAAACACAVTLTAAASAPTAPTLAPVSLQRYVMGTMIDIVVYHPSKADGARAAERAMREIERLDRVLSHFKDDSDLSRLNREASRGFVAVDASLYDIVQQSIAWSRRTDGTFDITIAPLLRTWKQAYADGRRPSDADVAAAKQCVGSDKVELEAPDRIHFRSACLAIDLGGIGKGYAVDRAMEVLKDDDVSSAMINAGGSSIGAIGTPPGQPGWAVRIAAKVSGSDTLLLRDMSMSTSQQNPLPFATMAGSFGEILDPRTGAPAEGRTAIAVVTPSGTTAEALTKALLMMPSADATALLARLPDVSALWMSPDGELLAAHGESRLRVAPAAHAASASSLRSSH